MRAQATKIPSGIMPWNSSGIMIVKRIAALLAGCHGGSPPRRGD
jgi:hypothetical protein